MLLLCQQGQFQRFSSLYTEVCRSCDLSSQLFHPQCFPLQQFHQGASDPGGCQYFNLTARYFSSKVSEELNSSGPTDSASHSCPGKDFQAQKRGQLCQSVCASSACAGWLMEMVECRQHR